jgi:hypothetical protein
MTMSERIARKRYHDVLQAECSIRPDHPGIQLLFSGLSSSFSFLKRAHRARTALRAMSLRCCGVSFVARAFPPFDPPIFPSATA